MGPLRLTREFLDKDDHNPELAPGIPRKLVDPEIGGDEKCAPCMGGNGSIEHPRDPQFRSSIFIPKPIFIPIQHPWMRNVVDELHICVSFQLVA